MAADQSVAACRIFRASKASKNGRGRTGSCSFLRRLHGSSEGHEMLKRNDKYHSIADDMPIPKM